MIAPTADARVPFGGRDRSGFGVTRGAEGLLEMTRIKTVITQRRRWLPHLDGARETDAPIFTALIELKVPRLLRGMIRGEFKKQMHHPVMLDWKGVVINSIHNEPGKANIYIVATDGTMLMHEAGIATVEKVNNIKNCLKTTLPANSEENQLDGSEK